MGKTTDYSAQDLVAASEDLLEDVRAAEDLAAASPSAETEQRVNSEILKRFMVEEEEYSREGYAEISVAEDHMEARADFIPPSGDSRLLEPDDMSRILETKEIAFGVDWNAIKEAVFRCNTERVDVLDVPIARGEKPSDQVPEHLVIEQRLLQTEKKTREETQGVDLRDTASFVVVNKDEVLARLVGEQQGREGCDVHGRALAYKKAKVSRLNPGKNTRVEADRVVADCDGRFLHTPNSFWVNEILDIPGDVDYRTGHVDFPGDVNIRGEIKAGFRVNAGGSVLCTKTMDASEVLCSQDLSVGWGLIGRKSGKVKVGGKIKAKFIENCYVEARGSIFVHVGILNSAVFSGDRVETGNKGVIAGGSVTAQNGIQAAQLGTRMGPRTELYCGTDYMTEQKLEWIRNKSMQLVLKLKQVETRLQKSPENREKLVDVRDRIKEAIHKLNEAAQSLIFQLDRNEEAAVTVSGHVYPGVYIEICHVSFVVVRLLKGVRFHLDKQKGKIIADPLLG